MHVPNCREIEWTGECHTNCGSLMQFEETFDTTEKKRVTRDN